jgi:hypothetical protein
MDDDEIIWRGRDPEEGPEDYEDEDLAWEGDYDSEDDEDF